MSAFETLTVKGFKSIAAVEKLPLGPINILIGANGAGKSNLIGALDFMREIRGGNLAGYVTVKGGAERLLRFGSRTTSRIELGVGQADGFEYRITLVRTDSDELSPEEEEASTNGTSGVRESIARYGKEAGLSGLQGKRAMPEAFHAALENCRVYHFADTGPHSRMRLTSVVDDNHHLRADGGNLASLLYLLQVKHPYELDQIIQTIRLVCPFFDRFLLGPQELNPDTLRLEWKHLWSPDTMTATALSDGTLRFIALAVLLIQPAKYRPPVILLDEPELGLHPAALEILAAMLKRASSTSQVIVSTQSSALVDFFEPEDIIVADRESGATTFRRLDPEPLKEWLEDYTLGQLWEKNEFGGRPGGLEPRLESLLVDHVL